MGAHDRDDAEGAEQDTGLDAATALPRPGPERTQLAERSLRPVGRDRAERLLEPERHLDVGQRVAAEADEGVGGGGVGAAQQSPDESDHVHLLAHRRDRRLREGAHRAVVGLAVRQPRHLGRRDQPQAAGRQAELVADHPGHPGGVDGRGAGADRQDQAAVTVGGRGHHAPAREHLLDVVEVDPQPEHLGEPGCAGRPPRTARRRAARPMSPVRSSVDGAPEGQVGRRLGVAEHHVRAVVDQLAARSGRSRPPAGLERAPGIGTPTGAGCGRGQLRRQVGHPGGRLGLAVHDEEVASPALAPEARRSAAPRPARAARRPA